MVILKVTHKDLNFKFSSPNPLCEKRYNTFSTKEPETLEWIEAMPEKSIVWDIGANIGLYSIYAAKKRNCLVWAFEPSVFNLEVLAMNVYINRLVENISIVPVALNDTVGFNKFKMSTIKTGGSLSTFGKNFGWDGNKLRSIFEFSTMGISIDVARDHLQVPQPDFIKIDVDGIENLILSGGASVLKKVKSVLIEVNDDFKSQAEDCRKLLEDAGLIITDKRQTDVVSNTKDGFQNTFNQIWVRDKL
jgi:FkbM family methyltransferase